MVDRPHCRKRYRNDKKERQECYQRAEKQNHECHEYCDGLHVFGAIQ
jgi:hypothetical protein